MRVFLKIASIAIILISVNYKGAHCQSHGIEAKRYLLKNGLTVLLEESHSAPLVAIEARIKTGSATEYGYLGSGISHFVEHMLFKGTAKRPAAGTIEREIKSLGGYINAFTSHDSTGVDIIVPAKYVNNALEILKDILTESVFDPAELEKEREVILKEVRLNTDEPSRYLSLLLWSTIFKAHNYKFPVIGHEELLKRLKREDLLNYYKTNYGPDNCALAVVGAISADDTFKTIDGLFSDIERRSPAPNYFQTEAPQVTEIEVAEKRDVALTYLSMGFRGVAARDRAMFDLDCLSIILGDGEDSRLFKALYKQKQLVYSIGSYNYTPKDPGIFVINAVLEDKNLGAVKREAWNQIELLKKKMVSDKELEKVKNIVLSSYVFSRQTVQGKAGDLAGNEIVVGDYDFSKKYVEGINAVTKESVREAAQKYLKRERLTVAGVIPKGTGKDKEKKSAPGAKDLLSGFETFELKNGLKVLILEDNSLPIVSVTAVGMGGLRTENFKNNGISNLVAGTLLTGTKTRKEDEIASKIEGAGAAINSFSSSNTFGIAASGLSKDLNLILDISSDTLQNPLFPQDKIEREKSTALGSLKAINDDIYQSGLRTLKYILFSRHPYRFQLTGRRGTITAFSQDQLLSYYRRYYCPNNMLLAVAGDLDKKGAKEKITRLFEKFEKRPPLEINPRNEKKKTGPRIVKKAAEKEQSLIMLGFLGTRIHNHDKYILQVVASILSGTNGRLSRAIREEKGLAYALDCASLPGVERGMVLFYVGTTKENLETAKNELFNQIRLLKQKGVNDEELVSAKRQLVGLHQMGLQKIQDVAARMAVDELYGLGFNNFLKYEGRINRVTKESVIRAAKKYLNDNAYVLVIIKGT